MLKLKRGTIAVLVCAAFGVVALADSAGAGWRGAHEFHALHGLRGFYGLYPYTLFGYPYQDNEPNCDFVWTNRSSKHKGRGVWTCS
jgi:hypothetical protein